VRQKDGENTVSPLPRVAHSTMARLRFYLKIIHVADRAHDARGFGEWPGDYHGNQGKMEKLNGKMFSMQYKKREEKMSTC